MGRGPSLELLLVPLRIVELSMMVERPTIIGAVVVFADTELVVAVAFSFVLLLAVGVTTLSGTPVPDMVSESGNGRIGLKAGRDDDEEDSDDFVG